MSTGGLEQGGHGHPVDYYWLEFWHENLEKALLRKLYEYRVWHRFDPGLHDLRPGCKVKFTQPC